MFIVDVEGDGLYPSVIRCLSVLEVGTKEVRSTVDYDQMRSFLTQDDLVIIGHNFLLWDKVHLKRLLGIEIKAKIIDTLWLSWYLYPERRKHGLEVWGEELRIKKPFIEDWSKEDIKALIHRCEQDVLINNRLWIKMQGYLSALYDGDYERLIDYLMFKARCASIQEKKGWRIDRETTERNLRKLKAEADERVLVLKGVMPEVATTAKRTAPARPRLKSGELSATGERWVEACRAQGKDPWKTEEITVVTGRKEPNPGSHEQLKAWLFSLGWEPCTFKYDKDKKTNRERKIPQIASLEDKTSLSPSVKKLIAKTPELESLEGLFMLRHRISILEGFLENETDGRVKAEVQGLTNTLRFKHTTVVNLPGTGKPFGKEVRECLTASPCHVLCGSDMASLEDRTKQHFIYPHDPDYVDAMSQDGWDPHLDIAVVAGMMTQEDADAYKAGDKTHHWVRHKAKTTNYSSTYGIGKDKLARDLDVPVDEAEKLLEGYWERNWAIKTVAEETITKELEGQWWLWNPVSRLWYSLRSPKDKFSTLNQGTGAYCFDTWAAFVLQRGHEPVAQFHDELVLDVPEDQKEKTEGDLLWAIEQANEALCLNRRLDISVQFGNNYSEIH